ncbi:MAG: carboxypeptidase-like regulatory domain-containing protein [Pirellulaceae bacterium]
MSINRLFTGCALVAIVAFHGCSSDDTPKRQPVTGTVTQNGNPVAGAIVAFTPDAGGLPASGTTDASGVYKLTTKVSGDGAVVGSYKITIAKYDTKLPKPEENTEATPAADPYDITNEYPTGYDEMEESEIAASIAKNLLPAKYAAAETSGLTANVVEGENTFDFSL